MNRQYYLTTFFIFTSRPRTCTRLKIHFNKLEDTRWRQKSSQWMSTEWWRLANASVENSYDTYRSWTEKLMTPSRPSINTRKQKAIFILFINWKFKVKLHQLFTIIQWTCNCTMSDARTDTDYYRSHSTQVSQLTTSTTMSTPYSIFHFVNYTSALNDNFVTKVMINDMTCNK